jgi:hypothetical protein
MTPLLILLESAFPIAISRLFSAFRGPHRLFFYPRPALFHQSPQFFHCQHVDVLFPPVTRFYHQTAIDDFRPGRATVAAQHYFHPATRFSAASMIPGPSFVSSLKMLRVKLRGLIPGCITCRLNTGCPNGPPCLLPNTPGIVLAL